VKKLLFALCFFALTIPACKKPHDNSNQKSNSRANVALEQLQEAKRIEAYDNLKRLSVAADLYHQVNGSYPDFSNKTIVLGPKADDQTVGQQYNPSDNPDYSRWKSLDFDNNPKSFTYYYKSDGKSFKAKACASLVKPCDTVITISGSNNGTISNPIDSSSSDNCNPL